MKITRQSPISGETNEINVDVTDEQIFVYLNGSKPIQEAFPNLTASEREFIKTGITEEEWKLLFGAEKETAI